MSTETKWTLESAEQLTSRAKHPPVYVADLDWGVLTFRTMREGGTVAADVLREVGAPESWVPNGWLVLTAGDREGYTQVWAVPALVDHAPAFDVLLAVDVLVDETR